MNKRNILTVVGIALSFVIAIGGWFLTSSLIEINSDELLSTSFSVTTNKLDNLPISMMMAVSDVEKGDSTLARLILTENEIVSILRNWDSEGRETPHEPTSEQLNMSQAIQTGRDWLDFIIGLNVFPDELLRFDNIRAYLFQNLPLEQGGQFLPLAYSYWTVSFTNDSMNVSMIINAVTGQVWKTDVNIFRGDIYINDYDITNALAAFASTLELSLDEGDEVVSDLIILPIQGMNTNEIKTADSVNVFVTTKGKTESILASCNATDGSVIVRVMATGWQLEDEKWNINNFKMHLIDKK